MSPSSILPGAWTSNPRNERFEPWIAVLVSVLMHLFFLFLLLLASKPIVTTPQGAARGGRMKVEFVGRTDQPAPVPPSPTPSPRPTPVTKRHTDTPIRSTLVKQARNPLPPAEEQTAQQPEPPAPSPPAQRHPQTWTGHPPGMMAQDFAPTDDGQANSAAMDDGSASDVVASAQPSMEVGGYQVLYDQRSETLLRLWKQQGMKEIAVPLPGTKYHMVCALEIALRRGSGKCRLLLPDSPEMQSIGDGREVINMIEVYKRGERVWNGPGPYR